MPAPINPLKAAFKSGQTMYGAWLGLADINSADIMGTAGFDWLCIDNEHSPNDLRATRDQLIALDANGAHGVVRVPVGEAWMIKQMLDIGAQSLVVPMVESGQQAADLVRACRYPPHGVRGVGSALGRASQFTGIADYGPTADDQICLILQVESRAGLAALDDILAVDGVDCVFIGPADLAADMGHMDDLMHPEVTTTILDTLRRIRAAGKAPGILTTDPGLIAASVDAGAQMLAVAIDVLLLAHNARAEAAKWIK